MLIIIRFSIFCFYWFWILVSLRSKQPGIQGNDFFMVILIDRVPHMSYGKKTLMVEPEQELAMMVIKPVPLVLVP